MRGPDGGRGSMSLPRAGGAILVLLMALGCGGGEAHSGTVSRGGLDGPDIPLSWRAEPAGNIGGIAAPEWAAFGEVTALAFDGAGNVYVLDGRRGVVTVVDSGGALVRTVGTPGEGPGELRFPAALAVHPDGAVTVYDPGHGGFVVYGPDGTFVRSVPVDLQSVPAPEGPLRVTAEGGIVTPTRTPEAEATDLSGDVPSRPVVVYADGPGIGHRIVHSAWRPPLPRTREPGPEVTGGMRVRLPPVVAFHPGLLVAPLTGGGLAIADSTTWRVILLDDAGRVTGTLERPLPPAPVTDAIRDAERIRRLQEAEAHLPRMVLNRSGGGSAAVPTDVIRRLTEARIEGMGFHGKIPVLEDLATDPGGRLWVRRGGYEPGEPGPVDVLSADGSYLGTLPAGVLPDGAVFGPGGLVAARGADDMGAPTVRLFRLTEGG